MDVSRSYRSDDAEPNLACLRLLRRSLPARSLRKFRRNNRGGSPYDGKDGSLCFFGSRHDEPSHAESANGCPRIWRPKATRVTWEPHVSIFRRMWWSNSTLTEALRLYSGLLVGDHKHGDLVAEEPKASSIST